MTRSKWAAVIVACLVVTAAAVAYAMGSATKVVRAERFELVDSSGQVTAVLAASPDGLAICDPKGKTRALVGMPRDGVPALGLLDENGRARISMSMTSDGGSELTMSRKNGNAVLHLIVDRDGAPGVYLNGANGSGRAGLYVSADESGKLSLYDKGSKPVWSAP